MSSDKEHVLLPLSAQAMDTIMHLSRLAHGSTMHLSPFAYEHVADGEMREIRGWVLDTPGDAPAYCLPVGVSLFDGLSIAKCDLTETEILDFLRDAPAMREKLGKAVSALMQRVDSEPEMRATWARCHPSANGHPVSLCEATRGKDGRIVFAPAVESLPLLDSDKWLPELSATGFVGFFYQWGQENTSATLNSRLSLFVACQSYLPSAALEFADMVRDAGDSCSAAVVSVSEEAYWLKRSSSRNRARILAEVCGSMGISVQTIDDHNASVPANVQLAICPVETLHHDMRVFHDKNLVRYLNYVSETNMSWYDSLNYMLYMILIGHI